MMATQTTSFPEVEDDRRSRTMGPRPAWMSHTDSTRLLFDTSHSDSLSLQLHVLSTLFRFFRTGTSALRVES